MSPIETGVEHTNSPKIFALNLPSQPSLGCHTSLPYWGHTIFSQFGYFRLDITILLIQLSDFGRKLYKQIQEINFFCTVNFMCSILSWFEFFISELLVSDPDQLSLSQSH